MLRSDAIELLLSRIATKSNHVNLSHAEARDIVNVLKRKPPEGKTVEHHGGPLLITPWT